MDSKTKPLPVCMFVRCERKPGVDIIPKASSGRLKIGVVQTLANCALTSRSSGGVLRVVLGVL
eukprot:6196646-Lingulodinium_polyedra.AAC.1